MPKKASLAFLLCPVLLASPLAATTWGKQVNQAMQDQRRGDLKGAEDLLLQALLSAQTYGDKDPRAAYTLDYLGTLYQQKGADQDAFRVYTQALAGFDRTLGPASPEAMSSCERLAESAEATDHWAEAEAPRRRLLADARQATRHDPVALAAAENDLGLVLDAQSKWDEALPLYQDALALREKALGDDAAPVAESLNNLGRLWLMKGDDKKAESMIRQAAAVDQKALGPDDPALADDWHRLAAVLKRSGQTKAAAAAEARGDAIAAAAEEKAKGPQPRPQTLPQD